MLAGKITIKTQLILAVTVPCLALLLVGAASLRSMGHIKQQADELFQNTATPMRAMAEVASRIPRMRVGIDMMLLQDSYDQPLFLQLKEARNSVLEPYTQQCVHGHQGKRVVFGQRLMQAASDLFLGWTTGPSDRHFYVRQLRDMKAAPTLESFASNESLSTFGQACAWALARAHAKSGGQAAELAGYIGQSDKFDQAIANYALAYADQVKRDFAVFTAALAQQEL